MPTKTERIEARFPADLKALAERAALASGYTLTGYLYRAMTSLHCNRLFPVVQCMAFPGVVADPKAQ